MVLPGIGSHSPFFQSRTSNGIASSPGVSCWVGTSTTSCSTPSTPGAMSLTARATPLKMSQSLRDRSEEHTSELQSLMRISYAVFCLKKKKQIQQQHKQSQ